MFDSMGWFKGNLKPETMFFFPPNMGLVFPVDFPLNQSNV